MIDDGFRLFPHQGSTYAPHVDALYAFLILISGFFTLLIAFAILYLAIKYRRGNTGVDRTTEGHTQMWLEVTWTVIPLIIVMVIFVWGAKLFFHVYRPPADALEIQVVGKQWMWKFQHPDGRREINTLHVPKGRAVRLNMISEDVIHSLFIPAFRVKRDVLPGAYYDCWFEAVQVGDYHLFCAEYCGTNHSRMIGRVVVQEPADYQAWLAGSVGSEPPAETGARLFSDLRCNTCHLGGTQGRCPPLGNLYGRDVRLRDGTTVKADDDYLRESILRPQAKIVAGFEPIMPSFEAQLNEEQLLALLAYIKSLAEPNASSVTAPQGGPRP
jgi:cytochrome c oxidase subunit 2